MFVVCLEVRAKVLKIFKPSKRIDKNNGNKSKIREKQYLKQTLNNSGTLAIKCLGNCQIALT